MKELYKKNKLMPEKLGDMQDANYRNIGPDTKVFQLLQM